jgi:hypothetical protein
MAAPTLKAGAFFVDLGSDLPVITGSERAIFE